MRHETVTIRCEMLSDPAKVQFHWTFNNSGIEVTPISHSRFSSNATTSWFNYTPVSEMDYGTLTCWGKHLLDKFTSLHCTSFEIQATYSFLTCILSFVGGNAIGPGMSEPCYFQIVQAGRPFPPR